jgi:hypothetical protein
MLRPDHIEVHSGARDRRVMRTGYTSPRSQPRALTSGSRAARIAL